MSKSIKFRNNIFLDSSSVVLNRVSIDNYLKRIAYLQSDILFSNTIGWKRILEFHGMAGGQLSITGEAPNGTYGILNIGSQAGYGGYISKVFKCITNSQYFNKARLVLCGNKICYLELYQAEAISKLIRLKLSIISGNIRFI